MLAKLPLGQLAELSVRCGLGSTVSRPLQAAALQDLHKRLQERGPNIFAGGKDYISLDLGLRNLAWARLRPLPLSATCTAYELVQWKRKDLQLSESYHPMECARVVQDFLRQELLTPALPRPAAIFIERQRYRTVGRAAILEPVIKLALLEAQLHAMIFILMAEECSIFTVNPGAVARYFDLPIGKEKKKAAIQAALELFQAPALIQAPAEVVSLFSHKRGAGKRDDLADCLLQGIAVHRFDSNCRMIFESDSLDCHDNIRDLILAPSEMMAAKAG